MPLPAAIPANTTDPSALLEEAARARAASDFAHGLALATQARSLAAQSQKPEIEARAEHLICFFHLCTGAQDYVANHAAQCVEQLSRFKRHAQAIELTRWAAMASMELGRFEEALDFAQDAIKGADAHGNADDRLLSCSAFAACLERMGDPWSAERLMSEALHAAPDEISNYARFVLLGNLAAVAIGAYYLLRDDLDRAAAHAALERALSYCRANISLMQPDTNTFFRVAAQGNLGEIVLHLGHWYEAQELLDKAMAIANANGLATRVSRIRCSQAELMLARNKPQSAKEVLVEIMPQLQDPANSQFGVLIRAHHALYRAERALGNTADALAHLEAYELLMRKRSVSQQKAQSRLFVTRFEAEQARQQAERAELEVVVQRIRSAELEQTAERDPLTGLGNRRYLARRWAEELISTTHENTSVGLAAIDLDHFKGINDRFGHLVGDRVLTELAQILRERTRTTDILVRMGGEEFVIVLVSILRTQAFEICERLRERVEQHNWNAVAAGLRVTVSLGLSLGSVQEREVLLARADDALYEAKRLGRNRLHLADAA